MWHWESFWGKVAWHCKRRLLVERDNLSMKNFKQCGKIEDEKGDEEESDEGKRQE